MVSTSSGRPASQPRLCHDDTGVAPAKLDHRGEGQHLEERQAALGFGDPLGLVEREGLVHPAVWPALANHVVHEQVARGSWVHVRSAIAHHAAVPEGSRAVVRAAVVERFERRGERAVLDVQIEVDDAVVVSIEHEAIVAMPGS